MHSFCSGRGLLCLILLHLSMGAVPSDYQAHHQQLEQALERASKQLSYDAVKIGVRNGLKHLAAKRAGSKQSQQAATQPDSHAESAAAMSEVETPSLNGLMDKAAEKELAMASGAFEKAEGDDSTPIEALNAVDKDFLRHFIQSRALQDDAWKAHVQRNARPQSAKSFYKQLKSALPAPMVPEAFKGFIANRAAKSSDFMYTKETQKPRKDFPLHQVHALTLGLAVPPLTSPNSGQTDKLKPVVSLKTKGAQETAKKFVYDAKNFGNSVGSYATGLMEKAKKMSVPVNPEPHKFKIEHVDDPMNPGADPFLPENQVASEGDPSKADLQQWEATAAPVADATQLAAMQARMDAMQQQITKMKEHITGALGVDVPDPKATEYQSHFLVKNK